MRCYPKQASNHCLSSRQLPSQLQTHASRAARRRTSTAHICATAWHTAAPVVPLHSRRSAAQHACFAKARRKTRKSSKDNADSEPAAAQLPADDSAVEPPQESSSESSQPVDAAQQYPREVPQDSDFIGDEDEVSDYIADDVDSDALHVEADAGSSNDEEEQEYEGSGAVDDEAYEQDEDVVAAFDEDYEFENVEDYVAAMAEAFDIEDMVMVRQGDGGLPMVALRHPNGSCCDVYLHGATVTSWTRCDGTEMLYMRAQNAFDGFTPLAGGVQLCFPQYGSSSKLLPTDGFSRLCHWELIETSIGPEHAPDPAPAVWLRMCSSDDSKQLWPHDFEVVFGVSLMEDDDMPDVMPPDPHFLPMPTTELDEGSDMGAEDIAAMPTQLGFVVHVTNTGQDAFEFEAGLPAHFAVEDLSGPNAEFVRALGLFGKYCIDRGVNYRMPRLGVETEMYLNFKCPPDFTLDRVYTNAVKGDVLFCAGDRTHFELQNRMGFRDVIARNPGDKAPDGESDHFVVFSGGKVSLPVRLEAGEDWRAEFVIRHHNRNWEMPLFEDPSTAFPLPRPTRKAIDYIQQ